MQQESTSSNPSRKMSAEPLPHSAAEFNDRMQELLDGQPKDEATVAQAFAGMDDLLDHIAGGLYSLASMLVGEGEESIQLVETAVATADLAMCDDPAEARAAGRRALCAAALETISKRSEGSLAAPMSLEHATTCIGDDELDAVGVSSAELEQLIAGPDRNRVKTWLESLPAEMRTVFVMRAVAGLTARESAALLAEHGGAGASGWGADSVREIFRQGLCSLASQVLHAAQS